MLPYQAFDFGDYRRFNGTDVFPGLTDKFLPLLIKETPEYTYVLAVKDKEAYVFAWDRVSTVYNAFEGF